MLRRKEWTLHGRDPWLVSVLEIIWLLCIGDAEVDRRYNTYYLYP